MKIFVGSLPFRLEADELRNSFEQYGEVTSATIISDKFSGRSKGFGFIEMPNDEEAKQAIQELNGTDIGGRSIVVNESIERKDNDRSSGSYKSKSGGYGNNNYSKKRW